MSLDGGGHFVVLVEANKKSKLCLVIARFGRRSATDEELVLWSMSPGISVKYKTNIITKVVIAQLDDPMTDPPSLPLTVFELFSECEGARFLLGVQV